MAGMYENDIEHLLNIFLKGVNSVDTLDDFDKFLDRDHTYCFELCDEAYKIVRSYPPSTIYLLSVINNKTF